MLGVPVSWPLICQTVVLGTGVAEPAAALGLGLGLGLGVVDGDVEPPPQAATAIPANVRIVNSAERLNMFVP